MEKYLSPKEIKYLKITAGARALQQSYVILKKIKTIFNLGSVKIDSVFNFKSGMRVSDWGYLISPSSFSSFLLLFETFLLFFLRKDNNLINPDDEHDHADTISFLRVVF